MIVIALIGVIAIVSQKSGVVQATPATMMKLEFCGEYKIDDGQWLTCSGDQKIVNYDGDITFRGKLYGEGDDLIPAEFPIVMYLYNLSISKKAQGKGLATKLMRPMLDFCDREQMVCYLETNKESNVSLYEHYDFSLSEKDLIPKSNVMHYAMVRKPISIK